MSNPTQNLGLDEIYVDAAVNGNLQKIDENVVNKNGTVPFVAEQIGVDPVNPQGLVTKHYVDSIATSAIMPDYVNGVSKAWNTQHSAECDGWLKIAGNATGASNIILTINNIVIHRISISSGLIEANGMIPVSKSDIYIASGGVSYQALTFYPVKGAN